MKTVLTILFVLVSLGLISTVLLQSGRSAGLSGAIAGGAETVFGKKKGIDAVLTKVSAGLAILFILLGIALAALK